MIIEYSNYRTYDSETQNLFSALKACRETKALCLKFEKDTYHFTDEYAREIALCIANHGDNGFKRTAFLLEDIESFEIDGSGSHFVFDSVMNMITALRCKNITLKNFSVSMPVCPYPEGKVVNVGENFFDVSFNYHEELVIENDNILIPFDKKTLERAICNIEFNGNTHEIEKGTGDNTAGAPLFALKKQKIATNTIRFFDPPRIPKLGNIIVLLIGKRPLSGFLFDGCEDVKMENITIHSCMGIGIMAQNCKNFSVVKCLTTSSDGKYVSTGADATHFVGCTGTITVENCLFEHMLDDALNVHGVYTKIHKAEKGKAVVKFCNASTTGINLFKNGDKVCQMDKHTLLPDKTATISAVSRINNELTLLTFEEDIEFTKDFILENISAYPKLIFKGCTVRNNRARGLLIASRNKCTIENCDFHTGGSAIVLECDGSFWYESGAVLDLTIRKNRFEGCKHALWGNGVIYIPPREKAIEGRYYHGIINIKDNSFISCHDDILYADNISHLIYDNNYSSNHQKLHLCNVGRKDIQCDAHIAKCNNSTGK